MIALPSNFNTEEMKKKVDKRAGERFFEKHGGFNPNNIEQIKFPWNVSMLQSLLQVGRSEFEFVMRKYTTGTREGSGVPENFAD